MKILKKQSIIMFSLLLSFTLLFTSCKSDEPDNPTPEQTDFSENWGAVVSRDFMGKVVDESDNPLSGVQVEIGSDMTTTDANGIYIIRGASVHEKFAYITAKKAGYIMGSRALVPKAGMNDADIKAMAEELVNLISSGTDSESTLSNGTKVKFDGAFKDENGNAYSGSVSVYMKHLSPSDTDIDRKMPGMLYAQNANNEERILETYGMLNVELRGSGGEILNLADGHTATIEIPIDPSQTNAPNTIELWHFDEENGYWIEDGAATKVGNKYIGEVSHFSWWNCDAQFPTINLCLNIEDTNGTPIYGATVVLSSPSISPRFGTSNGDGEVCGLVPSNEILTMVVKDPCGNQVFSTTIGPFSTDTNYGTVTIPALPTSEITGTLLDCNNNPVTDGYVVLHYDQYNELIYTVTNGTFTFTTASCNSLTNFTLEGIDQNGFESTGEINYTFTPPNTNVGNIITCNAIDEFITYQIDNDTPITNINVGHQGNSTGFIISGSSPQYIYIDGNSITPGTYNSPDFDLVEFWDMNLNLPSNIQFILTNYGANVGDYIDMTFNGTYTSTNNTVKNITGTVHVKRGN